MSRDPQLLDPATSIAEAAGRMQRFGHEGYPVVMEGRVVGLLTRRAVDRAMAHGMGKRRIETIMDAGEVLVHASDSVPLLQSVMIEHDWGQVPVVDSESTEIIGIVTRTDVLKTLADDMTKAEPSIFASELERALPASRLALLKVVARRAELRQDALFMVGGFVRDLLLGAPSLDFDLVVEGNAIGLARELAEKYGGKVSCHVRFGTAKWQLDKDDARLLNALTNEIARLDIQTLPETLDFVSARTEFYPHPTALPSVERGSIKLDLHRRDFTINTLAVRLDGQHYGQMLDFWGGGQDLKAGLIRVLHSLSFVDDPTRILRAVRLEQRLSFEIEDRTLNLLQEAKALLDRVSGDRIRSELSLIFEEKNLSKIMDRLHGLGLLDAIHPALVWDEWLRARFEQAKAFSPPEAWKLQSAPSFESLIYALWIYRVEEAAVGPICDRLHLPGKLQEMILAARRLGREVAGQKAGTAPSKYVARLEESPEQALVAAWLALEGEAEAQSAIDNFLSRWRFVLPGADGATLRTMGLSPGPEYGRILSTLRAAWLDNQIRNREEEAQWLDRLVREAKIKSGG